ncbi:uncharacterized protein SCHCODRAFT_02468255, partial [Schizophyllum commune H4-8]|uniref:uncharacterized protein n=1 Tax=Schizophyllum commune (strain H4-8 / FGSC 9210) TaxID=578458 RepID=UPI00215E805F
PDLSIIENLWDWIDKAVRSRTPVPYTKDEWWKAVQEEWKRIPQHYIDSLYDSIPRRLAAVCEAQGYYTKY